MPTRSSRRAAACAPGRGSRRPSVPPSPARSSHRRWRSEEHTSELQSLRHLVCRLLLEKKKTHGRRVCEVFFNDTATTEIYTLSLHDALPIWSWISPPISPAISSPLIA